MNVAGLEELKLRTKWRSTFCEFSHLLYCIDRCLLSIRKLKGKQERRDNFDYIREGSQIKQMEKEQRALLVVHAERKTTASASQEISSRLLDRPYIASLFFHFWFWPIPSVFFTESIASWATCFTCSPVCVHRKIRHFIIIITYKKYLISSRCINGTTTWFAKELNVPLLIDIFEITLKGTRHVQGKGDNYLLQETSTLILL